MRTRLSDRRRVTLLLVLPLFLAQPGCKGSDATKKKVPSGTAGVTPRQTPPAEMAVLRFPTSAAALSYVISKTTPSIIGFGEFHQQTDTVRIRSAIKRFTDDLLPVLKDTLSDLVVETWVSTGQCGRQEAIVTKEVGEVTKRPETTEDETVTLIKRSAAMGIRPRVLKLACSDYDRLNTDAGIDYLALLNLVGARLKETAKTAFTERINKGITGNAKGIAIFGGAIHNDAEPDALWAAASYGPALCAISPRYVEIDLYVPEFIKDSTIAKSEPWYPVFLQHVSSNGVALIERRPRSYILIFKQNVLSE